MVYPHAASLFHGFHLVQTSENQRETQRKSVLDTLKINSAAYFLEDTENVRLFTKKCSSALRLYGAKKVLPQGKWLHAFIIANGIEGTIYIQNYLIEMYGKCGSLCDAQVVFDSIFSRNIFSWTSMIVASNQNGKCKESLSLFGVMLIEGTTLPDKVAFIAVLQACSSLIDVKRIHTCIVDSGVLLDVVLGNALVNMYGKCGGVEDALLVFITMSRRDLVSWNTAIAIYAYHGQGREALQLFQQMSKEGERGNEVTFASIIDACGQDSYFTEGKRLHACALNSGFESDIVLGTALINMYNKCGCLLSAQIAFEEICDRNIVSWNCMMVAYSTRGQWKKALQLRRQIEADNMKPDNVTLSCLLSACDSLVEGRLMHAQILVTDFEMKIVTSNALINMYAACCSLQEAFTAFITVSKWNVASWNTMLTAYCQHGHNKESLQAFKSMLFNGVEPNKITFNIVLHSCAALAALPEAIFVHAYIAIARFESDISTGTALIDMYAKCGNLVDSCMAFDRIVERNIVSYNIMIAAFVQYGCHNNVISLLQHMLKSSIKPNSITLVNVISVFCNSGLVDEVCHFFVSMTSDHGITPGVEHHVGMITLLGRVRWQNEAEDFVDMLIELGAMPWVSFLSVCTINP